MTDFFVSGSSPVLSFWFAFKYFGIPIFVILSFFAGRILWLNHRQGKYVSTLEYTLLALDIPKENEQSPKAIENMFDQISGAHSAFGFVDKWWYGRVQPVFSFEIISIDGHVQFLIRTQVEFRDLVEASIYAQYPDAEITEVQDYVDSAPPKFPNEDYKLWGAEFIETAKDVYPIQTYPFFEHSLSQEFKDPMAALMEIMGSLRKGENVWLQYVVTMEGFEWMSRGKKEINKIAKRDSGKKKGGFFEEIINAIVNFFYEIANQLATGGGVVEDAKPVQENKFSLMDLTPGEMDAIKAIELKMGKIGFNVKMRLIYFAPKQVYQAQRGVSATVGAIKQFAGPFNGFKPESKHTRTKSFVFWPEKRLASRRNKILNAYRSRSNYAGLGEGFILNAEELATVFHFPIAESVKVPLVKRVETKKAEAPINLPKINEQNNSENNKQEELREEILESDLVTEEDLKKTKKVKKETKVSEPPSNLPIG